MRVGLITGKESDAQRAKVADSFGTADGVDVIIMSKVGSTGINLSAAHVLVLVVCRAFPYQHPPSPVLRPPTLAQDQIFSWWDKHQIIGRLNRGSQARKVIVYDLVALSTNDVVINDIARSKKDIVEAFLQAAPYGQSK